MIVQAMQGGLRIAEVPSLEMPRRSGKSNLHAIRDGMRVLRTVVRGHARTRTRATSRRLCSDADLTHSRLVQAQKDAEEPVCRDVVTSRTRQSAAAYPCSRSAPIGDERICEP